MGTLPCEIGLSWFPALQASGLFIQADLGTAQRTDKVGCEQRVSLMNMHARRIKFPKFCCVERLPCARKHHRMYFQPGIASKKAACLDGVRLHIAMYHKHAFASALDVGEQIFKFPDLVSSVNAGASAIVLNPKLEITR